jgi:hypothetical protein
MSLLDGLVSFYPLAVDGNDAHGPNDLTNNNGVAFEDGAAVFNGSNYLSIEGAAQTGLASDSDITMQMWINFTLFSGSTVYVPTGRVDLTTVPARSYAIEMNVTGPNKLDIEVCDGASNTRAGVPFTPSVDTDYCIVISYSKSNGSAKFYVNAVQQGATQTGLVTSLATNAAPFQIGAAIDGVASYFVTAQVEKVGVWTRELSEPEIAELFNGGSGLAYPFDGSGDGGGDDTPPTIYTPMNTPYSRKTSPYSPKASPYEVLE